MGTDLNIIIIQCVLFPILISCFYVHSMSIFAYCNTLCAAFLVWKVLCEIKFIIIIIITTTSPTTTDDYFEY